MADVVDLRTEPGAVAIERAVVVVSGPEAAGFLQGQLSQDVEGLAVGASARSLLLQPNGKVDAWLRATRLVDDRYLLDVDAGHGDAVAARLARFKLRTNVDIEVASWSGFAVRGPGSADVAVSEPAHVLPALWPGVEGSDVLSPEPLAGVGLPAAAPEALEALRVELGVPAMGAELTEATIPAEAGQWLIERSVSFTKGCYTGQELVARIDSRGGNVPRPIRGLLVEGEPVPVGAEVLAGTSPAGVVTSSARSPVLGSVALAPLSRGVSPGTRVELRWAGHSGLATVAELPLR